MKKEKKKNPPLSPTIQYMYIYIYTQMASHTHTTTVSIGQVTEARKKPSLGSQPMTPGSTGTQINPSPGQSDRPHSKVQSHPGAF